MLRLVNALDSLMGLQRAFDEAKKNDYFGMGTTTCGAYPHINIFKEGDSSILTAELAGVKKEDIKLEVKDNLIRVYGERKINYPEGVSVHRLERRNMKFDRTLKLSHRVNMEQIKADFKDGILKVILPVAESEKPKSIAIA